MMILANCKLIMLLIEGKMFLRKQALIWWLSVAVLCGRSVINAMLLMSIVILRYIHIIVAVKWNMIFVFVVS